MPRLLGTRYSVAGLTGQVRAQFRQGLQVLVAVTPMQRNDLLVSATRHRNDSGLSGLRVPDGRAALCPSRGRLIWRSSWLLAWSLVARRWEQVQAAIVVGWHVWLHSHVNDGQHTDGQSDGCCRAYNASVLSRNHSGAAGNVAAPSFFALRTKENL
jgi:hypothetical protein